jgi:threonyl-tRNA synthetase
VGRRIRDGELAKVPYLLVVGDREEESGTASARARGDGDLGAVPLEELAGRLAGEARGG